MRRFIFLPLLLFFWSSSAFAFRGDPRIDLRIDPRINPRSGVSAVSASSSASWTPLSPTTSGGVRPAIYFDPSGTNWQDSSGVTPAVADGDVIGGVSNYGTVTAGVSQPVTALKPLLKLNIVGGQAVYRLDGSDDYLRSAANAFVITQPFTVVCLAALDSGVTNNGADKYLFDSSDPAVRSTLFKRGAGTPDDWAIYAGSTVSDGAADSNYNILTIVINGAASELYVAGVSKVSGNAGTSNLGGLTLGASYGAGLGPWKGDFGKFFIYPGALSTADKNQLGNYMKSVYGRPYTDIP